MSQLAAGTTTQFVAPARQATKAGEIDYSKSIPELHARLQTRAQYLVIFQQSEQTRTLYFDASIGGALNKWLEKQKIA